MILSFKVIYNLNYKSISIKYIIKIMSLFSINVYNGFWEYHYNWYIIIFNNELISIFIKDIWLNIYWRIIYIKINL